MYLFLPLTHRVVFHNAACQPSVFLLDDCLCALHIEEENYQMSSLFTSLTGKPASTSLDPGLSFNSPPAPPTPPPWAKFIRGLHVFVYHPLTCCLCRSRPHLAKNLVIEKRLRGKITCGNSARRVHLAYSFPLYNSYSDLFLLPTQPSHP